MYINEMAECSHSYHEQESLNGTLSTKKDLMEQENLRDHCVPFNWKRNVPFYLFYAAIIFSSMYFVNYIVEHPGPPEEIFKQILDVLEVSSERRADYAYKLLIMSFIGIFLISSSAGYIICFLIMMPRRFTHGYHPQTFYKYHGVCDHIERSTLRAPLASIESIVF